MLKDSALRTLRLSLKFLPYKFTRNAEWRLDEQGCYCRCSSHLHNARLGCMKNCWKGALWETLQSFEHCASRLLLGKRR